MGSRYIIPSQCPDCGAEIEIYDAPSSGIYSHECESCGWKEEREYYNVNEFEACLLSLHELKDIMNVDESIYKYIKATYPEVYRDIFKPCFICEADGGHEFDVRITSSVAHKFNLCRDCTAYALQNLLNKLDLIDGKQWLHSELFKQRDLMLYAEREDVID